MYIYSTNRRGFWLKLVCIWPEFDTYQIGINLSKVRLYLNQNEMLSRACHLKGFQLHIDDAAATAAVVAH